MLKLGTTKCPADKNILQFKMIHGMRIKQRIDHFKYYFTAKCPSCNNEFKVEAPRD
jgi:hypothetical protein